MGWRPDRIELARTPTPLEPLPRLQELWGGPTIWVKRDDLTGFGLSGNKVRKLEYHLAAAAEAGADTVVTCGAEQSNHCRATALAAARLGLRCHLVIRTATGEPPVSRRGNHLLHHLAGAELSYVDPATFRHQADAVMAEIAAAYRFQGRTAWVIPAGASDGLGMFGMADAFVELHAQLADAGIAPATVWHASSSAGTTAGFGWGRGECGSDTPITALSVGEDAIELEALVSGIWAEAEAMAGQAPPLAPIEFRDDHVGAGYGLIDAAQPAVVTQVVRATGLLFDPTYTGKAMFALCREIETGRFGADDHVVFWHTGGGFAALI